ncbi:MAG: cell wall-associated protein wapA [Bdellovibrio sp.]|nr:MAG: cell wall-associated protein wapA [Bdellovibrio sp.]
MQYCLSVFAGLWLWSGLVFWSPSAMALVDMKTANYAQSWTDIELPSAANQFKMKIERTYNSRSLYEGMFGFGWCSSFETKIEVTPEGSIRLTECGAGQEVLYMAHESSRKDIDNTINQIIPKLRESKKFDDKGLHNLAEDLITNHKLRTRYANEFKIRVEPKDGVQYLANGREVESFSYAKGVFTRKMPGGTQMRFNRDGKLTQLTDSAGNFLKLDYEKDALQEITDNNGRKFSFKYYNNKKVKTINGPNANAEYKFEGLVDLVSVKNQWGNVYTYDYDDEHNLTKVTYPDKTFVKLDYNKEKDWVIRFLDRDKCVEDYAYEMDPAEPKLHYWSTVKKVCNSQVVTESKHEFVHKKRSDGQIYLQKVVSTVDGNVTEVLYHEIFGKPISVRRNADATNYEYYPNGLVKIKSSAAIRQLFKYETRFNKVSEVTTTFLNAKGKKVSSKESFFEYDKHGNISLARNSDGQKVTMTYDDRGRVKTMLDQAKKIMKVEYEERFGKPSVITRPGLGTIKVSYKGTGEIDKVNSGEGGSVAMQVASIFNNLLEILSPATPEVYTQ